MYDQLEIEVLRRQAGANQRNRLSIDFLVNGASLFEATNSFHKDLCGRFSSDLSTEQNLLSEGVFIGQRLADTRDGRVMLFVCPECGDLSCGAITIAINSNSDSVTWSAFGYENDYDESMTDLASYQTIGPFTFRRAEYLSALAKAATS